MVPKDRAKGKAKIKAFRSILVLGRTFARSAKAFIPKAKVDARATKLRNEQTLQERKRPVRPGIVSFG